jgi:urease accessory protein
MLRAIKLIPKPAAATANFVATITLDRQSRFRRRVLMQTDAGQDLMLDLETAVYMADGDCLELADGGLVKVLAAPEPLLEIHAADPLALARIAWHIGNRHTPAEITTHALYIQPDHVLEEMVLGLGAHVHHVVRPFEPEGGAYGGKGPLLESHHGLGAHSLSHGHDHGHDHAKTKAGRHVHAAAAPEGGVGKRIPSKTKAS